MVSIILRGGLGNNLYMIAATFVHALKHGFDYAIPLEVENPHFEGQKSYIFPGIHYCEKLPQLPLYKEPAFTYTEIPPIDNIILDGYFQSFRYIDGYRDQVLRALWFKWYSDMGWCAIHVRRGDYMQLPDYHPFVGEKYLKEAIEIMDSRFGVKRFKIFSNDRQWCENFFQTIKGYSFAFTEGNNEMQDLEEGSYCEHQILSNGTFALWMHYLNQNPDKICIAPKRWFGKLLNHDTRDLYPENAILI